MNYLLEQLNPSPAVYGSLHVHVKFGLNPSLTQSALTSHGAAKHGSVPVTVIIMNNYSTY